MRYNGAWFISDIQSCLKKNVIRTSDGYSFLKHYIKIEIYWEIIALDSHVVCFLDIKKYLIKQESQSKTGLWMIRISEEWQCWERKTNCLVEEDKQKMKCVRQLSNMEICTKMWNIIMIRNYRHSHNDEFLHPLW